MIRTDSAIEIVKKKSSNGAGSGTMMMAKIAIIKATTIKSLERKRLPTSDFSAN